MEEKLSENIEETNENSQGENEPKGRFYTDEEIEMIKQKVGDQRVSQAMKSLEKKQRESNKLKNMTEEERYSYELEQKERDLEERENKLILAENRTACMDILAKKGLDMSLVDFVVAPTADEMDEKIKVLEKAFKASVKKEVEKRLVSSTPKMNLPDKDNMTKADLSKMSVRELQLFKNAQPQLYSELMGK